MSNKKIHHKVPRNIRECGPTGKRYYKNEQLVEEAVGRVTKKSGLHFRSYFCNFCAGYHLTRQKKG